VPVKVSPTFVNVKLVELSKAPTASIVIFTPEIENVLLLKNVDEDGIYVSVSAVVLARTSVPTVINQAGPASYPDLPSILV